jgi:hypothetical protein
MTDFTVREWARHRKMSLATYYKIRRLGRGPEELTVPGTNIHRITATADEAWEKRMMKLKQEEAQQRTT